MGKDSNKGKYASPEGSRTWEYISAIVCAIGAAIMGILIGWNSPSLAEFTGPNSRIPMTPSEASTLMACLYIGQILGAPLSVVVVDWIGRKNSILVSAVPVIASWGMIAVAESVTVLIVARILGGLSMGLQSNTLPIYMAEIFSANIRGSLGIAGLFTFYLGILFMFLISPYLGVRVTAGVCMGIATIFLIFTWIIPESPYFLVMVDRVDEAEDALAKLRGKTDVADELELIKTTVREKGKPLAKRVKAATVDTERKRSVFMELFATRGNLKAFFIGMILTILQHMSGLGAILSYCHLILEAIGSGLDVYVVSVTFGVAQVLSAALTTFAVDRFGRRPLLLGSGVISGSLLAVVAIYFYLVEYKNMDLEQYGLIPLCSIFVLVMAISVGITPLPGLLISELFATNVKMLATSIIGVSGALTGVFSTKSYLMATSSGFGHTAPFFGYTATTLLCTALLARLLPETKGKTLLQIQRELNA